MLGAAAETRGSIAAVVETYRAQGLFKRWPIRYLPTDGAAALKAARALAVHARSPSRWRASASRSTPTSARAASGAARR
jgi:hypothetical protein